ncbi:hypothetical protein EIP91_004455 [Steccherinum ochraceum]|uniref:DUF6593 domain-containing protein n=1 Tax=Steccherinum ochraceum TaxID=92696 RepID=A0A4R0R8U7_9APHY|nr:hypothetical protein EIP91_004455 [Steccherinum ochraceum]
MMMDPTKDTRSVFPGARVLEFSKDSFLNANITDRKTEELVYTIRSVTGLAVNGIRVVLSAVDGGRSDEVANFVKGAFFKGDKISFRGGEPMKAKQWMHDNTFYDPDAKEASADRSKYSWLRDPETLKDIALFKNDGDEPIAWFRPSVRSVELWPATLIVHPDAFALQDIILASLLVAVQTTRARDSQGQGLAQAMPFMQLTGGGVM